MKSGIHISSEHLHSWKRSFPYLAMGLALLMALPGLLAYLKPDLNLILVILAAPFVLRIKEAHVFSQRYIILVAVCISCLLMTGMRIFFLFSFGATLLYIIEAHRGKMGVLPLGLLFFLSPVPNYLAEVFTFPIRLWMSKQTASLLSILGWEVSYQGNIFLLGENSFSVDPACMGLNSLVTGLILTILLIAFAEEKHKKELRILYVFLLGLLSLSLLICSNFFRMVALVILQSPAETFSHEVIGLASLILYGIVPIYFLVAWTVKHKGHPKAETPIEKEPSNLSYLLVGVLLIGMAFMGFQRTEILNHGPDKSFLQTELPGMKKSVLEGGINKYENEDILLYLKAPARFWGSDHSPNICWRASGFSFGQVEEYDLAGKTIYLGQLQREGELLYTTWWYDNGEIQTHSQIDWRLRRLKGEAPFLLVNVTAEEKETALAYSQKLLINPFQN